MAASIVASSTAWVGPKMGDAKTAPTAPGSRTVVRRGAKDDEGRVSIETGLSHSASNPDSARIASSLRKQRARVGPMLPIGTPSVRASAA